MNGWQYSTATCVMIGTIIAGFTVSETMRWVVTTALRLMALIVTVVRLKRE
jgi:hypothetical protein